MEVKSLNSIESHLLSYAFIRVNDSIEKDYYDVFIPFVKEVLKDYPEEVITANKVQELLINNFKISLPIQVVVTLLKRLRNEILRVENNAFKLISKEINNNGFQQKKQQLLTQHTVLIENFMDFANKKYNMTFNYEEAEVAILNLIRHNSLNLFKNNTDVTTKLVVPESHENRNNLIAANYIISLRDQDGVLFNHLLEIVKGYMLLESIFTTDANDLEKLRMKFNGTEIYFDTSFILYALGYSGEAMQKPCLELLKMLKDSNAHLRCFSHNIDEARAILEYLKRNFNKGEIDRHNTIQYFLDSGFDEMALDNIIFELENDIHEKLGIKVINHIPYNEFKNVLGEQELRDYLQMKMNYRNQNALETDIASISAIYRLRKGIRPMILENSKAIFVTTNYHLDRYTREFFVKEYEEKIISPVIHDSIITNLVWLKNPQIAPNLHESLLMADCYAAIQPSDQLWKSYLEKVETLEESGRITTEQVAILKYTQGIKTLLVNATMGEDDVLSIGTVQEILSSIEKQEIEKRELAVNVERDRQEEEKLKLKKELLGKESRIEEYEKQIENIARRNVKKTMFIILAVILAIFVGLYIVANWYFASLQSVYKILAAMFLILLAVSGILGISIQPLLKSIKSKLYVYHIKKIRKTK